MDFPIKHGLFGPLMHGIFGRCNVPSNRLDHRSFAFYHQHKRGHENPTKIGLAQGKDVSQKQKRCGDPLIVLR